MAETDESPVEAGADDAPTDEPVTEVKRPSRAGRALRSAVGNAANLALVHRNELIAALELLRERAAVSDQEEGEIVEAYDQGDERTRAIIGDLVERLEEANFGKVVIRVREEAQKHLDRFLAPAAAGVVEAPQGLGDAGAPAAAPSLPEAVRGRRTEVVGDLVKRGREALAQEETRELEQVFFRWSIDAIEKAEQILVRALVGAGALLLVVAVLWSAHQVVFLQDLVRFASVFLLVFVGIALIMWSSKVSAWAADSRKEMDEFLVSSPSQRLHKFLDRRPGGKQGSPPEPSAGPPTDK